MISRPLARHYTSLTNTATAASLFSMPKRFMAETPHGDNHTPTPTPLVVKKKPTPTFTESGDLKADLFRAVEAKQLTAEDAQGIFLEARYKELYKIPENFSIDDFKKDLEANGVIAAVGTLTRKGYNRYEHMAIFNELQKQHLLDDQAMQVLEDHVDSREFRETPSKGDVEIEMFADESNLFAPKPAKPSFFSMRSGKMEPYGMDPHETDIVQHEHSESNEVSFADVRAMVEAGGEYGASRAIKHLWLKGYTFEQLNVVVEDLDKAGLISESEKKNFEEQQEFLAESIEKAPPYLQELFFASMGKERYNREPLVDAFGTLEAPCVVPSAFNSRIVGCPGGDGSQHDLLWFDLIEGVKHCCPQCGQIFQLAQFDTVS